MGWMLITPWFLVGLLIWIIYDLIISNILKGKTEKSLEEFNKQRYEKITSTEIYKKLTQEKQDKLLEECGLLKYKYKK